MTRLVIDNSNPTARTGSISRDLTSLETFKDDSKEPVSTFIRNFERHIEPHNLSEDEKRLFILRKLTGLALFTAETCVTYTEVKEKLLAQFEPSQTEIWHKLR